MRRRFIVQVGRCSSWYTLYYRLHMEPFSKELWRIQNAEHMADQLEGHLLSIHGDLDK